MQFTTAPTLPVGRPGMVPDGVNPKMVRAYANSSGGAIAEWTLNFQIASPPAMPMVNSGDERDRIKISVATSGGCCIPGLEADFPFPDPLPANQTELHEQLLAAINENFRLGGLGRFFIDGTDIRFRAYQPGLDISFMVEASVDRVLSNVTEVTEAQTFGQNIMPGLAVVYDPSANHAAANMSTDNWDIAFLPTQDVGQPGSTQKWAGVVLDCADHENPPAYGQWPDFTNCNDDCAPPPICLRVLEEGPVFIELEEPFDFANNPCPPLQYRFAPDGDFTQLGAFSLSGGAGLADIPDNIHAKIVKAHNSRLLHVRFT